MEVTRDYYATLRVPPEAESAAIRVAYRNLMRRYHPDVNPSDEAASEAVAINEAYACLRDPAKRASYDRSRRAPTGQPVSNNGPTPSSRPRPAWTGSHAAVKEARTLRPTWWQAAGLGGAAVITAVTFAATSASGPFAMPPTPTGVVVQLRPANIPVPPPTIREKGASNRSIAEPAEDAGARTSSR